MSSGKMYKVTCNGRNLNYGKDGVHKLISDIQFKMWERHKNKHEIPFYLTTAKYDGSARLIIRDVNTKRCLN